MSLNIPISVHPEPSPSPARSKPRAGWRRLASLLLLPAVLPLPGLGVAQDDELPAPGDVVAPVGYVSLSGIHPGGSARLAVVGEILPGWHVNAHLPSEEFLIPTELSLQPPPGLEAGEASFPQGEMVAFEFSDRPLRVYEGRFTVLVPLTAAADATPGETRLKGVLTYQACSDRICLPPADVPFELAVRIAGPAEAVAPQFPELFPDAAPAGPEASQDAVPGDREVAGASLWVFGLIYLGGLALNLTPCVFPIIPITVAFFGGQANRSLAGTLGLSSLYVLGMAATYSTLGVVTALSGSLFGAVLQSPWTLGFVALVLVGLAMSQFGLYEFRLPGTSGLSSRRGALGALFMGLVVGLVAAPCIGPFVLALLLTVAREADPWLGFWKFFVLSLGLGTPYLFLGAFSGNLSRLPRAGEWMEGVKHVFGLVLLAMAAYFLGQALPPALGEWLFPAALAAAALWLLLGESSRGAAAFTALRLSLAAVGLSLAAWMAWPVSDAAIRFEPYSPEAIAAAAAAGRPVLLDFTAEWCVPCREYEHSVFNDPAVLAESERFVSLQADLTRSSSPEVQDLIAEYGIFGPPTIIFIDGAGEERRDLRLVGFVDAGEFLRRMQATAGGTGPAS